MTTDRPRRPSSGGSSSDRRPRGPARGGSDSRGGRPERGRPQPESRAGSGSSSDSPRKRDGERAASSGYRGGRDARPGSDRDRGREPRRFDRDRDGGRPGFSGRSEGDRPRRDSRDRDDAPRHDDPVVDDDVTTQELERSAWRELKALTKENAEWVAGHLVMASRVIDDDPERAHKHALAAARRAGRIPVVRETVGITAYLAGDFALALRELRTYRRLSGSDDQIPLMVDCERGLGRPQKALELAGEVSRTSLPEAVQVELAIARSGARLDMGETQLALGELEIPQLSADVAFSYSPALFDSYAIVLAELGRADEAAAWGRRANIAAEALREAGGDVDDMVVVEIPAEEL